MQADRGKGLLGTDLLWASHIISAVSLHRGTSGGMGHRCVCGPLLQLVALGTGSSDHSRQQPGFRAGV